MTFYCPDLHYFPRNSVAKRSALLEFGVPPPLLLLYFVSLCLVTVVLPSFPPFA